MKVNPERVNLADSFPLPGPLSVVMESTSRCNSGCIFCFKADKEAVERFGLIEDDMSRKTWHEVKRMLAPYPKLPQMHFHYDGEPTMHPHLTQMVAEAVQCNLAKDYMIRTNGFNLAKKGMVDSLVSCGLTRIGISIIAVNGEGYVKLAQSKAFMFERVYNGVKELFEKSRGKLFLYAKIIDFGIPETDLVEFHRLFDSITDIAVAEYPRQWNNGVKDSTLGLGVKMTVNGDQLTDHIACPYPFFTQGILSDGRVVGCCFDPSASTTYGNVHDGDKTWYGDRHKDLLRMHLEGCRKDNPACRNCVEHMACPDTVDDRREEMLEKLDMLETNGRA